VPQGFHQLGIPGRKQITFYAVVSATRHGTRIARDPLPQQREEIAMAMHTAPSRRGLIGTMRKPGGGSDVYA